MKKIITLILLLMGMVCTVNADWYVSGDHNVTNCSSEDWGEHSENMMTNISGTNIYVLVVENKSITAWSGGNKNNYPVKFTNGTEWYGDNGNNIELNFQGDGTYTIVYYFDAVNHTYRFISTPMLRWGLGNSGSGNWNWGYEASSMFTKKGDYSWTYELTPTTFTDDTSFRLYSSLWDKQAYPTSVNLSLPYGSSCPSSKFEYTTSDNCWRITKPTYTYEKVVITATYKPFDTTNSADWGQWDISADAYISKTITAAGYATFGSNANVDFSKAIPTTENNSFVAKKGKVQSNGTISWTNTTTLYAGEGALLQGDADTYLIPVAASATADTEHNDFKAIDSKTQLSGANHYILTNQKAGGGESPLGFYKVNSAGSWCAANTAYLETNVTPWAHDYFPLDDESASVERIVNESQDANPVYDLQGRCVTNPQKGLYILNGKKVVIK